MTTDEVTALLRVLCVTQPGDGHFNPLAQVAAALAAAGHDVLFATSRPYIPDVKRRGFEAVPVGPDFRWDAALQTWPAGADHMGAASAPFWLSVIEQDVSPAFTTDVLSVVADFQPDLLLAEYATLLAMTTVRELTGLPLAMTAWGTEPGSEAFLGSGLGEAIKRFRSDRGLAPCDGLPELEHWIVFTPPSWGTAQGETLGSTLRALQPSARTGIWCPPPSTGPFVYGTLGTVYNTRRRLGTIVDAIGLGGWSGLVTVGNTMDPADFAAAPQVAVERYVPQADVLQHADVMLCHGGLGSVLGAIESATPMVIVPLGADQLLNAEIARKLGIAMVVDPAAAGPQVLCDAIAEVLSSAAHRAASTSLREEAMAMMGMKDVVRRLAAVARGPSHLAGR